VNILLKVKSGIRGIKIRRTCQKINTLEKSLCLSHSLNYRTGLRWKIFFFITGRILFCRIQ